MQIISNYQNDDRLRAQFNHLSRVTFGISFEEWYAKGFWGEKYQCFSLLNNNTIIANVSVNTLKWIINGKLCNALQLGTVMTDEAFRNQGLSKKLMDYVLDKFSNNFELIYLFANKSVVDFYPKFGFTLQKQYQKYTHEDLRGRALYHFRKLDIEHNADRELLKNIVSHRLYTSSVFDVLDGDELFCWYCLSGCKKGRVFVDDQHQIIVFYTFDGRTLLLHDVVFTQPTDLTAVIASLGIESKIEEIVFGFNVEIPNHVLSIRAIEDDDSFLFVKGNLAENTLILHRATACG